MIYIVVVSIVIIIVIIMLFMLQTGNVDVRLNDTYEIVEILETVYTDVVHVKVKKTSICDDTYNEQCMPIGSIEYNWMESNTTKLLDGYYLCNGHKVNRGLKCRWNGTLNGKCMLLEYIDK